MRARGLKRVDDYESVVDAESRPMRARGLKLLLPPKIESHGSRAPCGRVD